MKAGADDLVVEIRGGARLCVAASLEQITTYVLLEQEDWFEEEIRFVRRWLRPGMRAIDVGANVGVYAVTLARAVGGTGRVWAYEPTPDSARRLRRNAELNGCGNLEIIERAVTEAGGELAFSAGAHSELNAIADAGGNTIRVHGVTLDAEAAARGWQDIDFLKLDVEGHEPAAIRGGAQFLRRETPLLMLEILSGTRFDGRALDALVELGYQPYRLLPGPLVLVRFEPDAPVDPFQLNLFACKPDRARRLADEGLLVDREVLQVEAADPAWDAFAYSRGLAPCWRKPGFFANADRKLYWRGLAAFAASVDGPAEARLGLLTHAARCVSRALDARPTLARKLSHARLSWALGWRQSAVEVLKEAASTLHDLPDEPFLAPSERYERTAGALEPGWLRCAVLEQYERLRRASSYYTSEDTLEVLAPIGDLPWRSAEVDRRRNLVRLRLGMLQNPEPSALLAARSEENLNPDYWR